MRRTISCCLSLALLFTLSFLLQEKTARGGDTLPPGCCQFFSEADFAPVDSSRFDLPRIRSFSTSASHGKNAAHQQLFYVPKSVRKWNFDYQPANGAPVNEVSAISLRNHRSICFRLSPAVTAPGRSPKMHIAPMLFWGTGSAAEATNVLRLVSREAISMLEIGLMPLNQLPIRLFNIVQNCIFLK